jgi:membrane-bound lytic murein transglycosylase B
MASIPPNYRAAFQRWGYLADAEAQKYGVANGATLLAKIAYVETKFSSDLGIKSYAGARGPMQFMPSTRDEWIKKYGVDPWKSVDEAVHGGALFMKGLGLDSYNPGSSTYIDEVLKAPVGISGQSTGPGRRPRAAAAAAGKPVAAAIDAGGSAGSTMLRFLLSAVFVLGGFALMLLGLSRAVGSSPFDVASRQAAPA